MKFASVGFAALALTFSVHAFASSPECDAVVHKISSVSGEIGLINQQISEAYRGGYSSSYIESLKGDRERTTRVLEGYKAEAGRVCR